MNRFFYIVIAIVLAISTGCATGPHKPFQPNTLNKVRQSVNIEASPVKIHFMNSSTYKFIIEDYRSSLISGYSRSDDGTLVPTYDVIKRITQKAADVLSINKIIKKLGITEKQLYNIMFVMADVQCSESHMIWSAFTLTDAVVTFNVYDIASMVQNHSSKWLDEIDRYVSRIDSIWGEYVYYIGSCHRSDLPVDPVKINDYMAKIASFRYIQKSYNRKPEYAHCDTYWADSAYPDFAYVQMRKAEADYINMDYENGDQAFIEADKLVKDDIPDEFVIKGFSCLTHGSDKEAEVLFKKALDTDPKYALAYYGLTCVEIYRKNTVQAVLFIQKANKLQPDLYVPEMVPAIKAGTCQGEDTVLIAKKIKHLTCITAFGESFRRKELERFAKRKECPQPEIVIIKNREINLHGELTYDVLERESFENANTLAIYSQKSHMADEAAAKLIAEYGVEGTKEEVAAMVLTTQKFTNGDASAVGSALTVSVVLTVNADEVERLVAGYSKAFKAATCRWSRNLRDHFNRAMNAKKSKEKWDDYDLAVKKARALNRYNQYMASSEPNKSRYIKASEKDDPLNEIIQVRSIESDATRHNEKDALEHQVKALAVSPGLIESYIVLGNSYIKSGDYNLAIAQFEKALKIDPAHPLANYLLARAYSEKGDKTNAQKYMALGARYNQTSAFKMPEFSADAVSGLDQIVGDTVEQLLTSQAVVEGALGITRAAELSAAVKPEVDVSEAVALRTGGDYRRAISKLEKQMKEHPDSSLVRLELGRCYYKLKEYNNAIEFFKKAGGYYIAPYYVGLCYEELDNPKEAVQWFLYYEWNSERYKHALKDAPEILAECYSSASKIFYLHNKYESGVKYGKKSIEAKPTEYGYFVLGKNYHFIGDYDAAIACYEKSLQFDPDDERTLKALKEAKRKTKIFGIF